MSKNAITRRAVVAGLAAAAGGAARAPAVAQSPAWRPIEITGKPIERFHRATDDIRFGRLTFRGGLVLTSPDTDFGGLSGLALEPNGEAFIATSDDGSWLTGDIVEREGRPQGLKDVRLGALLAADGSPYRRKRDKDCEAVALLDGDLARGTLLMAFERNHKIERFLVRERVVHASVGTMTMPRETSRMDANKGIEAMTSMAGGPYQGAVVAYSERLSDTDGNHTGWLWLDGVPQRIGLTVRDGFDVTDVASLPDGSLIVLERRYRWTDGVRMQLRLVPAAEIAPGRIAVGDVLFSADSSYEIDNMEGLAIHRHGDGTTILTLISDDNFNRILQRTILLRFALSV